VCLKISDTGFGIEASILKHLFEPFFTTKAVGEGSGLGLASAYGIVHQHKGWITVDSVLGHGTNFHIYLPLSERAETIRRTTSPLFSLKGQNETILLVEDEAALLFVNTRALEMFGYKALTAKNGPEALTLWEQKSEEIDLLLTDMRMPKGITGLELARKLRATKPSLKVVIMSGYSLEIVRDCAEGQTDFIFLAKPFSLQTLSETLRRCFE
jgi:CheY-like chemotaxis protein